jgi:trehalose 2-sulfotransferase
MARCFIVAATARSGSNYLCSLLTNNRVGAPREHFNGWLLRSAFARAIASGQSTEKFAAEIRDQTKPPFATKILSSFIETMLANSERHLELHDLLAELYPKARYVFLSRRDKVEQAISRARAEATNEWFRRADQAVARRRKKVKPIKPDAIHTLLLTIQREELEWRRFFARSRVKPLEVVYEDLCTDPAATLARIGRFLVGPSFEVRTLATSLVVQRDAESNALRQAYLQSLGF